MLLVSPSMLSLRLATFVLAWLACAASALAQWTTPPSAAPGVSYHTFWSPAAQATVSFHVYLPPAYQAEPSQRFPVLYWLHGSGNGVQGIPFISNWFATAMAEGHIPPMLVVLPNGMASSMWCDSLSGVVPMESVVIDDLIPHVDATFRTIAARHGRIVEGFSMGGSGAGRLGLRHADLFAGVSMLGAGPMQLDFMQAPNDTSVPPAQRAAIYQAVWGSSPDYYLAQHPWTILTQHAQTHISLGTEIRIGVGELDAMLPPNLDFHQHLLDLNVPHQLVVVPGVGHDPAQTLQGLGQSGWEFYIRAFAAPCPPCAADFDANGGVDGGDLAAFFNDFESGHPCADVDHNGGIDGGDLAQFFVAFEQGGC
jgi:enterochelin esterase-like enzyme